MGLAEMRQKPILGSRRNADVQDLPRGVGFRQSRKIRSPYRRFEIMAGASPSTKGCPEAAGGR